MKRCFSCLRADNRKFERSAEVCEECIDFPGKFQVPEFAVPYSGDDAAPRRGLVVSDGHSRVHIRSDKLQALAALLMQTGYVGGGMTLDEPCKSPLRDRIASRARRAGNEARRAENLKELQYLLDKNPEVARILELLEAAGERDFV